MGRRRTRSRRSDRTEPKPVRDPSRNHTASVRQQLNLNHQSDNAGPRPGPTQAIPQPSGRQIHRSDRRSVGGITDNRTLVTLAASAVMIIGCTLPWAPPEGWSMPYLSGDDRLRPILPLLFTDYRPTLVVAVVALLTLLMLKPLWRIVYAFLVVIVLVNCFAPSLVTMLNNHYFTGIWLPVGRVISFLGLVIMTIYWLPILIHPDRRPVMRPLAIAAILPTMRRYADLSLIFPLIALGLSGTAAGLPLYALAGGMLDSPVGYSSPAAPPDTPLNANGQPVVAEASINYYELHLVFTALDAVNEVVTASIDFIQARARPRETVVLYVEGCSSDPCTHDGAITIHPEQYVVGGNTARYEASIRLPAGGDPRQYPFDTYGVSITIGVFPCDPQQCGFANPIPCLVIVNSGAGHGASRNSLDINSFTTRVAAYEVSPEWGVRVDHPVGIIVDIQRPAMLIVYVLAVVAIPLVFAVLISQSLALSNHDRPMETAVLYATLAAVGLTVLPLRAAVEPSDIAGTSLTRADLLLGSDLGLLATIAAFNHLRRRLRRVDHEHITPAQ